VIKNNDSVQEVDDTFLPKLAPRDQFFKPDDPLGFLGQYPAFGFLRMSASSACSWRSATPSCDERRGDVGPGLPRSRGPKTAQLQAGRLHRLRLQPVLTAGISFLAVILIPTKSA